MPTLSSEALVLRTFALGETSLLVVFLTRERGKVRAVAKGARGPRPRYRSALLPLSEVRVSLHGRQGADLLRLGECELVRSAFAVGARGVEQGATLSYFAELLDAFAQEGEADDVLYRLARAVLAAAEDGKEVRVLSRYLEGWLLRLSGVYPPIDRCASCDAPLPGGPLAYHAPAHGFVCGACGPATGPVLPVSAREFLVDVFRRPPADVAERPRPDAEPLAPFHRDLIERHLERPLRSLRVIQEIARS
jgi:DNA repair protein RecO (recombination protein O)